MAAPTPLGTYYSIFERMGLPWAPDHACRNLGDCRICVAYLARSGDFACGSHCRRGCVRMAGPPHPEAALARLARAALGFVCVFRLGHELRIDRSAVEGQAASDFAEWQSRRNFSALGTYSTQLRRCSASASGGTDLPRAEVISETSLYLRHHRRQLLFASAFPHRDASYWEAPGNLKED